MCAKSVHKIISDFLIPGPTEDIPVKVTGNVKNGFTAEFLPIEVGIHMILVEYNGVAVGGTPYYSKAYDSESVGVTEIPKSLAGKTVTFAGKLLFFKVSI
jgi:filamin